MLKFPRAVPHTYFQKLQNTAAVVPSKYVSSSRSSESHARVEKEEENTLNHDHLEKFAHAKTGHFFQDKPKLFNQFSQDAFLQGYLKRHVPEKDFVVMKKDLEQFGARVANDIYKLSLRMEREEPKLEQYDAWGERVDNLITSTAWQKMKQIAAEEGLVACAYDRPFGEFSRLYQMAKFYLFEPSAGLYGCPLAMTNGAARTMELIQDQFPELSGQAYKRLTTRDPHDFWTAGQWMTEKMGGSDVAAGTETVAVPQSDGSYRLYGYKWFSSATDADMTLTLARVVDQSGGIVQGTRGLSMFYLELRDDIGNMNGIQMVKLKNKLGTRQLPTAELLIDGARAYRISDEGRGVASMASVLTLTRIHTAIHASSAMRRIVNLARDYSTRRVAFGKVLHKHNLHVRTLAQMEIETRAAAIFVLEVSRLLGRQEVGHSTETENNLLRLVVPVMKLYTAKQSVSVVSEGLECFGGQGYIEDTDLPRILRDTQVCAIWEGTTNILSLDVLRAVRKSNGSVLTDFQRTIDGLLTGSVNPELSLASEKVASASLQVLSDVTQLSQDSLTMAARDFAYSLARIYMGALLINHANGPEATPSDVYTAVRWCEKDLTPLSTSGLYKNYTDSANVQDKDLVFEN